MDKHRKSKLMRMAGNIAAGLVDKKEMRQCQESDFEGVAEHSIKIAEAILDLIEEKYPDAKED